MDRFPVFPGSQAIKMDRFPIFPGSQASNPTQNQTKNNTPFKAIQIEKYGDERIIAGSA